MSEPTPDRSVSLDADTVDPHQPDAGQEQAPSEESASQPEAGRSSPLYDTLWLNSLLRPVLITIMVGCINVAFVAFVARVWPGMPAVLATIMLIMAGVAGLIGGYSTTLLFQPDQRFRRTWGYRMAELVLLVFLTRGLTWSLVDGWPQLDLLLYRPVDALLSLSFLLGLFVIVVAWGISATITHQFLEMALKPDELLERGSSADSRFAFDSRVRSDRQRMLTGFTEQWIGGGVFLLMLTASSQVESIGARGQPFVAIAQQSIDPVVIGATLLYFLLGLGLLGIGRLAVLRARWQIESIPGGEAVMSRWPLYTLGLLLVVGLFSLLLPIGSTFWLGQALSVVLGVLYLIIYLVMSLVLGLLAMLFPSGGDEQEPVDPLSFIPEAERTLSPSGEVPAWIGGSVFWVVISLLLIYAAYIYFSGKGFTFSWLAVWWSSLRRRWKQFWAMLKARPQAQFDPVSDQGINPVAWISKQLRRIQLGRLSPSQRVRYFYLTMLDEAKDRGIPRRPSETPFGYAPRLEHEVEEETESIDRLTQEFVDVHYGQQDATEDEMPILQQIWQKVRKAIQHQVRQPSGTGLETDNEGAKESAKENDRESHKGAE